MIRFDCSLVQKIEIFVCFLKLWILLKFLIFTELNLNLVKLKCNL